MKSNKWIQILTMSAMSLLLANCAGVSFDKPAGTQASSTAQGGGDNSGGGGNSGGGDAGSGLGIGPGGGDISNSGNAGGVITGQGNVPSSQLPKIQFIGPPCQRLSNCAITFQLDKAYPDVTEFDWETNDSLYGTSVSAGMAPWGKPGFPGDASAQYVPTSGHVSFAAGQTSATVYVRNINQQDVSISIGVLMSNCAYSSLLESCQKMFGQ
jgi:hypothetical protein